MKKKRKTKIIGEVVAENEKQGGEVLWQVLWPEGGGLRLLQVRHRHANWNWAAFEDDPGAAGPLKADFSSKTTGSLQRRSLTAPSM